MRRITDPERAALPIARAALEGRGSAYGVADSIVFALGEADMLRSAVTAGTKGALSERQLADIDARIGDLDHHRAFDGGAWMSAPVDEKSVLPPHTNFVVEDVLETGRGALIRSSVAVFAEESLARFTAHARQDVPALVADVRRLRAERDAFADRVDTLTAVAKGNKRHVASLLTSLVETERRVAELTAAGKDAHRAGYRAAIEVMRAEKLPMSVGLLEAQLELDALDEPVPYVLAEANEGKVTMTSCPCRPEEKAPCGHCRHDRCEDCGSCSGGSCRCNCLPAASSEADLTGGDRP